MWSPEPVAIADLADKLVHSLLTAPGEKPEAP